jgi:hypothetical protein
MPFRLWRRGELRITARPVEPTSPHRIHAPSSATVQRCHHDLLCYACRLHYAQIRPYINSEDPLAASLPVWDSCVYTPIGHHNLSHFFHAIEEVAETSLEFFF